MKMVRSGQIGRFQAAILSILGWHPDYVSSAVASSSDAGITVTDDRMLSLSAVWACARLISETIATLPLSMYETTSAGKRIATQHPLHFIIHDQPNADTTASVHWEATIAAMLLRGNGRAEKLMVGDRMVGLQFLNPCRLSISCRSDGRREYRYTERDGRQRVIPEARIFNIPGFSLDGREGVSVVSYGANVFGAALAANRAANNTFSKGLHPTTVWKFPQVLRKDQRDDARATIKTISGAVNAGEPAILEAGMDVETIGINPNDAQLLESRGFSVEEICRWFRVPPFMVGHSEKSTSWGTGIEQQMIGFLTFTLAPWLKRIEQAISKDLLSPKDRQRYYPKFNVEGLLRSDSQARSAFYSAMVNNGIYTRDEVRELEDREPMGGNANVLTVQTALAPLDSIGTASDANQARASLRAFLGLDEPPKP
jgi:HK97 family phage portal protein